MLQDGQLDGLGGRIGASQCDIGRCGRPEDGGALEKASAVVRAPNGNANTRHEPAVGFSHRLSPSPSLEPITLGDLITSLK